MAKYLVLRKFSSDRDHEKGEEVDFDVDVRKLVEQRYLKPVEEVAPEAPVAPAKRQKLPPVITPEIESGAALAALRATVAASEAAPEPAPKKRGRPKKVPV